jgi:hypothetical protein
MRYTLTLILVHFDCIHQLFELSTSGYGLQKVFRFTSLKERKLT